MKEIRVRSKKEMKEALSYLDDVHEDVVIQCKSTTIVIRGSDSVHYPGERKRFLARARGRLHRTTADAFREV